MIESPRLDKVHGCLIGLAIGDALGLTVESQIHGSFEPITDMVGGGKYDSLPGQWTDDTSMALCIAESLIECQGFNPIDQLKRFLAWYEGWHMNCSGELRDIGMTTRKALEAFRKSNCTLPYPGPDSDRAAGNGSIMRLAPIPLAYSENSLLAMELSSLHSRTTHGAQSAMDACKFFAALLVSCINGEKKEDLLSANHPLLGLAYWSNAPMVKEIKRIADGSYKHMHPPDIKSTGYVVDTLEAALWAFYHTDSFKSGCLKVSNLGGDSDTVAAVYGQIAGAYYGYNGIPEDWRNKIFYRSLIRLFASELYILSNKTKNIYISTIRADEFTDKLFLSCLSIEYNHVKVKGFSFLEEKSKYIIRRLKPCPKQYKSLEEVETDIFQVENEYRSFGNTVFCEALLKDFTASWNQAKYFYCLRIKSNSHSKS